MGRKKRVLTEAEVEERKRRWWGPERNARRRDRYQSDESYREKAIQQVRESYRRARISEGLPVREDDCRKNISLLPQIGQVRDVRIDDDHRVRRLTFTLDELAQSMCRNTQVVYRWIMTGMLPSPMFEARNQRNRWQSVYLEDEVTAILQVFGKHQETSQYYRAFHTETRDVMLATVDEVRRKRATNNMGAAA